MSARAQTSFQPEIVAHCWIVLAHVILRNMQIAARNTDLQINTQRYAFDYLPILFFLAALGFRERATGGAVRFWKGLICWAIGLNVLVLALLPTVNRLLDWFVSIWARQ